MTSNRDQKRAERYNELRRLGFNSREASRLKDRRGSVIERAIEARRRNLAGRRRLNPEQMENLRVLNERRAGSIVENTATTFSERDRQGQFEEWSQKGVGFPDEALERIREWNDRAGKDENDGFGFRRFYYEYVKDQQPSIAARLADRDDS